MNKRADGLNHHLLLPSAQEHRKTVGKEYSTLNQNLICNIIFRHLSGCTVPSDWYFFTLSSIKRYLSVSANE